MRHKYLALYNDCDGVDCEEFGSKIGAEYMEGKVVENLSEIIMLAKSMVDEHVSVKFDPTLVRGMGYYTGPIFEITIDDYNFSIAGGGRYDEMIGKFSGQNVCASGFSIGFERIITILKDKMTEGMSISDDNLAILVAKGVPSDKKLEIFNKAKEMRAQGKTVTVQPMRKNMKQQIDKLMAEGFTNFDKIYND